MISLLYKPIIKKVFMNIEINNRLEYLLFLLFIQIELLMIFNRTCFVLYLLLIVLMFDSISDYYCLEIYSLGNYILIVLGILIGNINYFNLIIPIMFYILSMFNLIGEGDSEIFLMLSLFFNYEKLVYIVFITFLLSSIYLLINKKDKICLVPFISLSVLIIYSL